MINESVQYIINTYGFSINPRVLLEASLNRVLRHIGGGEIKAKDGKMISAGGHFAILTSWRKFDDRTRKPDIVARDEKLKGTRSSQRSNRENFVHLVREIRSHHLGCIRLTGSWLDSDGDQSSDAIERSLFIPGSVPSREPGDSPKSAENDQGASPLTQGMVID